MTVQKEVMEIKEKIPIMTYSQYRRARKLVHQCCNYESGNCLSLDDGEECVCVQSISYSLLCNWFRAAVLPLDEPLVTALLHRKEHKRCAVCGQPFLPGSNRAKYCKSCAAIVHRRQKTASDRKRRAACGQLETKKVDSAGFASTGQRDRGINPYARPERASNCPHRLLT